MAATTGGIVRNFPDRDRLSVLIAVILLAFALTNFIQFSVWEVAIDIPGFYLPIDVSIQVIVLVIVAGLTAAGADWVFHDHPALSDRKTISFLILPSLTSFGIGLLLNQLPYNALWWFGLFTGGTVLALVLVGEYISIDTQDIRQPIAAAILISVSFALFLVLAIGLHISNLRLFFMVPMIFSSTLLVSLRSLHLRMKGEWVFYEAALIAAIVAQLSAALIYWPLSPISFGLLLLGPAYGLNSLFIGLIEEKPFRELVREPLIVVLLTVGVAAWVQ